MKKILNSILLLSLLLVLNVKADMGPPELPQLEMEVSNPDGAKCYYLEWNAENEKERIKETGKVYKYGTKLSGNQSDLNESNNYYLIFEEDEDENDDEKKKCYIKETDLTIKQDNFDLSKAHKDNSEYKVIVETKVYSGPSKNFYKVIGTIPKDIILKIEYSAGDYWHYVDYNGIKGWISGEDQNLVSKEEETIVMYEPKDYKTESGKVTIPAGEEFNEYWVTDYNRNVYVVYDGKLINTEIHNVGDYSYFATKCTGSKIEALKELSVYSYENNVKKKIGTLEVNKKYDVEYCFQSYGTREVYYLPSLKGWVDEKYEVDANGEILKSSIVVYDKDGNSNKYEDDDPKKDFPTPEDPKEDTSKEPTDVEPPKKDEPTPKKEESKGLSNDELIMICVGAGVIIAVTILVIIKLVNKKKNDELTPVQENNTDSNQE